MTGSTGRRAEAGEHLAFGVGVWIRGAPVVTAYIPFESMPTAPADRDVALAALALHRVVHRHDGRVQASLSAAAALSHRLAAAIDAEADETDDLARAYRAALSDLLIAGMDAPTPHDGSPTPRKLDISRATPRDIGAAGA